MESKWPHGRKPRYLTDLDLGKFLIHRVNHDIYLYKKQFIFVFADHQLGIEIKKGESAKVGNARINFLHKAATAYAMLQGEDFD